jgi:stringent starvation protein B
MSSQKPYLIRAFFNWIMDNQCTPYIVVQADYPNTKVPQEYVDKNGQIVFNITTDVVKELQLENKYVAFSARFSGASRSIYIPIQAIVAIYAKENGQGMVFEGEESEDIGGADSSEGGKDDSDSFIKVIK